MLTLSGLQKSEIKVVMKNRFINNKGFTLIEVIAVLIVLGIVSAVVISRVSGIDEAKLQAEIDTLKGHLRYAQSLAMNEIPPVKWGVQINAATFTLVRNETGDDVTFDSPYNLPNESSATHTFENGISASAATVLFDEWGSPGATSITVTMGGKSITITANTGFIP